MYDMSDSLTLTLTFTVNQLNQRKTSLFTAAQNNTFLCCRKKVILSDKTKFS